MGDSQGQMDRLTGIHNREGYNDRLERLKETGRPFSVIYVDLVGFKPVDDTHGHPAGDALLVEVAKLLETLGGTPFRLGGDEFALILPEADLAVAEACSDAIVRGCNVPFVLHPEGSPPVTVSIGASVGCACLPLHAEDMNELLREVDYAHYLSKKRGRNQYAIPNDSAGSILTACHKLVSQGRDPNAPDEYGVGPLHRAVYYGQMNLAALLLDLGALPNIQDMFGRGPLDVALFGGDVEMRHCLKAGGSCAFRRASTSR